MGHGLLSIVAFKLKSPLSIGTRGESRGATQVNAYSKQKSLYGATGRKKPASLFSGTSHCRKRVIIPLLYNGSARIGLLARRGSPVQLGGPFGFCAFA